MRGRENVLQEITRNVSSLWHFHVHKTLHHAVIIESVDSISRDDPDVTYI